MVFYKRNLPHLLPDNSILSISFRLAESVPEYLIRKLREEHFIVCKKLQSKNTEEYHAKVNELRLKYFYKIDDLIDKNLNGITYLKVEKIAEAVYKKIMQFDN